MNQPMPTLIGHRGVASVAPENTAAGIRKAAELGIDWIELDVTLAGDHSLVMMHDPTLKRFTHENTRIRNLNRAQLETVDAGSWFGKDYAGESLLFLEETLALVRTLGLGLNLEIKVNPDLSAEKLVERVLATPGLTGLIDNNKLLISSFHHPALAQVARALPGCPLGALFEGMDDDWRTSLHGFKPVSIHCFFGLLSEERAKDVLSEYPLYCYTVNDAVTLKKLVDMGVNGVFSDRAHAEELKAVFANP